MISDVFSSLGEAPPNGPVRSSVLTHPVFESNRGQRLVQLRRRHIFDSRNQVSSLWVSRFSRRACQVRRGHRGAGQLLRVGLGS